MAGLTALSFAGLFTAHAQFKEIGPPPFSKAVAHQRIRAMLDGVEPGNREQTIDQLNKLVPWFRDVLDEELISAWQRDGRDRLLLVMKPMADPPVASGVVGYSWHTRSDATLNPGYAPMFTDLMSRYPESSHEFLSDLLGTAPPQLGPLQEEAVCRILIDMPETGNWSQSTLQILPRYRATAERLLQQDSQGPEGDRMYRGRTWLAQLRGERPGASQPSTQLRRERPVASQPPQLRRAGVSSAPNETPGPMIRPPAEITSEPPVARDTPVLVSRPSAETASERRALAPAPPAQPPATVAAGPQVYNGPMSGTLECTGNPIAQNAEYVFRNLPLFKLQLDYDHKIWEARLVPAENQSQRLILKNKSSGPQKRCQVHWSVIP
jgi:hypothetical protein